MKLPEIVMSEKIGRNKIIIDFATENVKDKANAEIEHKKINHVRMYKKAQLPFELIAFNRIRRIGCFKIDE